MAAVTADRFALRKLTNLVTQHGWKEVAASVALYQNTLAKLDANGRLTPCVGADGSATKVVVIPKNYDNSSGAAGDIKAKYENGVILQLGGSGFSADDEGKTVYVKSNWEVSLTDAGTDAVAGTIFAFESATSVFVHVPGMIS